MQTHSTPQPADAPASAQHTARSAAPPLWPVASGSLGVTVLFYVVGPWIAAPLNGTEFFQRYFCGHPLEYVTSAIFFLGMAILWNKLRALPRERRTLAAARDFAARHNWSAGQTPRNQSVTELTTFINSAPAADSVGTAVGQRLQDILHHLTRRTDAALDDHLKYLADLSVDRLVQSFQLVRTVTWAVPIMGFLGTVIGITMAIANVTPEQLDSSLPEVTSGLAVAFDTTAQALGMSMLLVFGTFLIERAEQSVLNELEEFGINALLPAFGQTADSQQHSGTEAAELTARMLAQQAEFWNARFASLQSDWQAALSQQTSQLARHLAADTEATLSQHRDSLALARDNYANALQQSSQTVSQQFQQAMSSFVQRVDVWQSAMQTTSMSAVGQTEELHRLGRTLLQLTESEERLARLQDQLNQNLQALQIVDSLEQTVSSLNAAVAALTARTHLRSAA
ncbi:MAG: MotA/TolQ/ExbB proton channel family protein [Planctomycetaceae bacterium]